VTGGSFGNGGVGSVVLDGCTIQTPATVTATTIIGPSLGIVFAFWNSLLSLCPTRSHA
jgi:hypothetical protein